jgi:predicted DNA-binding protein with PD1-like motif
VVVLDRGEELMGALTGFLAEKDIRGGTVTGIGALVNHTVGYYDLETKEYLKRTFEENMEMGNLTGTIGTVDGSPFLHAHVTVSGPELIAFTGHLVKGEVAVTAELFVTDYGVELPREMDEDIGLKLFRWEPKPEPEKSDEEE